MADLRKRLYEDCRRPQDYPKNLLRTKTFSHTLERYSGRLAEVEGILFDPNPEYTVVDLLEAQDARDDFISTRCRSLDDLTSQFETDDSDPTCRFVFFESDHSRAPLDCSIEIFLYVMSILQVMPPFLDLAFGLGKQYEREDFYYTAFRHEHYLDPAEAYKGAIPQFGRSGIEYRQCYNLWSVERSDAGGLPWSTRQTAFYHSFDIDTGHALWVNISPNSEIKSRITKAASSHLSSEPSGPCELTKSKLFAATLTTHLVVFEWSVENWRGYISSLDTDARGSLTTVNNIPVDDVEQILTRAVNSDSSLRPPLTAPTARTNSSATNQPLSTVSTAATYPSSSTRKRKFSGLSGFDFKNPSAGQAQSPVDVTPERQEEDPFKTLNKLSFNSVQSLSRILALLNTAHLVMGLNRDILLQQIQYYEQLLTNDELPVEFRAGCTTHIAEFCRRVRVLAESLKMEQARVNTLVLLLSDGKDSFDKILQFRNIATGKLFALHGYETGERMEKLAMDMAHIAVEAKRETTSMHIITFVALIFLPATFVATFLSSGVFQWDSNTNTSDPLPVWRPQYFALFAQISLPLTGGTVLVWLLAFSWKRLAPWVWERRRRVKVKRGDEEDPKDCGLGDGRGGS